MKIVGSLQYIINRGYFQNAILLFCGELIKEERAEGERVAGGINWENDWTRDYIWVVQTN